MSSNIMEIEDTAPQDDFGHQMEAYAAWKNELAKTINYFQYWTNRHRKNSPEIELRLFDSNKALQSDQLTIAFVAEFSRGKTELINAIFFSGYGQRLLPSNAGRTTMCPTELLYDRDQDKSYIRLLPIETRLEDLSLNDLKQEDSYWTTLPLNVESPDQMTKSFHEIIKTKQVSRDEADRLGLLNDEVHQNSEQANPSDATVEIPHWRHAIISFPHPLLKQGLVILDTPGLNALGSEPELTLNMLPSAQAIFFVLSADTGVTKSDLEMWKNHIKAFREKQQRGLVAVLNKIDTLWDEMKQPDEVNSSIQEQCKASANMLGMDAESVFPVSAQKALLAKIKNNDELLRQSNLGNLELLLANDIVPEKQRVVWDSIVSGLDQAIDEVFNPIASELNDINSQLTELSTLQNKNEDVVKHLIKKAKVHKIAYLESVKSFQASRRKLAMQASHMFNVISPESIDKMIEKTRKDMAGSWTTGGLKNGMSIFFDSARDAIQIVNRHMQQTNKLINYIYKKFNEEHGLYVGELTRFSINKYIDELDQLYLQAEEYRNSTLTTMTEQSFVIKKFFVSLVSHVRNTFVNANHDLETWLKESINPLAKEIKEKKNRIDKHMETLNRIQGSKEELSYKMNGLVSQKATLDEQISELEEIRTSLQKCCPPENESSHQDDSSPIDSLH
ncbi:MAG: dynamin family protein [Gammaproteobacteria bacterium]